MLFVATWMGLEIIILSEVSQRQKSNDIVYMGFPRSSVGKESACSAGDLGSIPGLGRYPGGEHGNPLQYSCLENPQGQRNLAVADYNPWGQKELDTTE